MSGEYGTIASRAAFREELRRAIAMASKLVAKYPAHPAFQVIGKQLDVMQKTTDGRDPSEDERQSIDVGLVVVRELEGWREEDVFELGQAIHPLAAFYEDWPTDEDARREALG